MQERKGRTECCKLFCYPFRRVARKKARGVLVQSCGMGKCGFLFVHDFDTSSSLIWCFYYVYQHLTLNKRLLLLVGSIFLF